MSKYSFILHQDSLVILEKMTDEQAGQFIKILYNFHKNEEEAPNLDFAMEMAITPFLNQFKRDKIKYNNVCEARKLAGSKGGKQKVANASKSKQKVANLAESDNDNDNDNKKDITSRKEEFRKLINENKEINKSDLEDFFDYWSEKNKDGSKMRFEKEKTFEPSRRLKTWMNNKNKWSNDSFVKKDEEIIIKKTTPQHDFGIALAKAKNTLAGELGINPSRLTQEQVEGLRSEIRQQSLLT